MLSCGWFGRQCSAEVRSGAKASLCSLPHQQETHARAKGSHFNRCANLTFVIPRPSQITVNSRVVIVGASDTATALLESLVFSPHLHLSNLSLVSPHTLTEHPPHEAGGGCLPDSCCYGSRQLALLGLKHWVNTVRGTMVAIDRCGDTLAGCVWYKQALVNWVLFCLQV